ncbi:MAG: cyclase family protein [Anaerolineales bacterium]|jgi:arylformamidase
MRIYDISLAITPGMPVWPGDPGVELERVTEIAKGANSNTSRLTLGVHSGTHVDAPVHFLDGDTSVETLALETLTGRATVVDLPQAEVLDAATLEAASIAPGTERLLFKTRNSAYWRRGEKEFQTDFVGVDAGGAEWLVSQGVRLVGVDYLSVAPFKQSRPTHRTLLEAGVVVVEGLDLSRVNPGTYTLYCLPLKLVGSDGAPARAILVGE